MYQTLRGSKIGGQNPPRVQHGPVSDDQGVLVVDRVNVDDLKSAVGTNHTSHAWRASVSGYPFDTSTVENVNSIGHMDSYTS